MHLATKEFKYKNKLVLMRLTAKKLMRRLSASINNDYAL